MAEKLYKCTNYFNCSFADEEGKTFKESELEEIDGVFVCPKCKKPVEEVVSKKPLPLGLIAGIAAGVIALGAGGFFLLKPKDKGPVEPPQPPFIAVESVQLDQQSLTLEEGTPIALIAMVSPENATDPSVTWSSSNPEVVAVNERGELQLLAPGKAVVTAAAGDQSASCPITVTKKDKGTGPGPTVGNFSGQKKNGFPHGQGTLTFTQKRLIDTHDEKGRMAEKGDYIIGEWDNGHLIQGKWYDATGNAKGSIVIGKAMNPEADHTLGKVK